MIITISGTPGSGKSTVAKLLAKKLNFKHYSSGEFMRDMAEEKNMGLLNLIRLAEKDRSIDEEIDQRQIGLGRTKDNFVIDSRLGFHFIPKSKKIFIDADFEERAKRIFCDTIRKEHNVNLKSTKQNIRIREISEKKRYKKYYELDPYKKSNYDLVIDSTNKTSEQVVEEIIKFLKL